MQFLDDTVLGYSRLQNYVEVDSIGDIGLTQNMILDGFVIREDFITLTIAQTKQLIDILQELVEGK